MIWLFLLIIYILTSVVFYYYPHLLHKPKNFKAFNLQRAQQAKGEFILHISHRGGSREAFENSIQAFTRAVDLGTNIIKIELRMTKDGTIVVASDSNLNRLCKVDAEIAQKNYKELPAFSEEIDVAYANNLTFKREKGSQTYFTTLEEVFLKFPQTFFMLDIRGTPDLIKEVNDLIQIHDRDALIIWGNSQGWSNMKSINPSIPSFFPDKHMILIFIAFILGFLPFLPLDDDILCWPKYTEELRLSFGNTLPAKFKFFKVCRLIQAPVFYHLQRRGILIFQWILNTDKHFRQAIYEGANGIITDSPKKLKKFLDARDQYNAPGQKENDLYK